MTFPVFEGNCPRNVSKDAKYRLRNASSRTKKAIESLYKSADGDLWHPSTDEHPQLVEMVNAVKTEMGEGPGGPFYINEYKQVIVPINDSDSSEYYLAGIYEPLLEFDFDGKVISGKAEDLDGNPISPGDKWAGSHHGIPYVLRAGGKDIKYKRIISSHPKIEREEILSGVLSREQAKEVAKMVATIKGPEGGRFYVNEYLNVFAPLTEDSVVFYYCGRVDLDNWFPMPHAE